MSRVSAKNWEDAAQSNREALSLAPALLNQVPPLPLDGHGTGIKKKKILKDIPPADRVRIAEISVLASKNTRWSAKNSPQRLASEEMDRLIEKYVIQRKVPAATFARYAGVTRRAIMQRVEKNNRS